MAPPHLDKRATERHERNREIALLSDLGLPAEQIARKRGLAPSTVRGVIKRYRIRGSVEDAPRSGRPKKISSKIQQQVESTVLANSHSSLTEITDNLHKMQINISRGTVDTVIKQLGFKLLVPRKKPYLDAFTKIRRKYWCYRRKNWQKEDWRKAVWLDESRMEFVAYQPGRKVRIRPGEELLDGNITTSFKSDRVTVNFWAAFTYGFRTPLVRIRKRKPSERTTPRDRLGLNAQQYATEIYDEYLIPFLLSLNTPLSKVRVVEDNAKFHLAGLNKIITEVNLYYIQTIFLPKLNKILSQVYGVRKLPLPSNSPDLNPIENVWHILKSRLRKRFAKGEKRPHSEDELWEALVEEWERLDQDTLNKLVDSMPNRLEEVIKANGSHTKW